MASSEVIMKITLHRVFKLRIWLGVRIVKFGIWLLGGHATVGEVE